MMYQDGGVMYEDELLVQQISWIDAAQEQFGSVPWWVVSTAVHVAVLALLTLITVSTEVRPVSETITVGTHYEEPEIVDPPIRETTIIESEQNFLLDEDEKPVMLVHEEPEIEDAFETDNNSNLKSARGTEDAISDIPQHSTGCVSNIGLGGGTGGAYGTRFGGNKKRAITGGGGSGPGEVAVQKSLRWLARNQEPDGHWAVQKWEGSRDEEANVGVTGLALLAFLGSGHTEKTGEYRATVRKAVLYLISKQNRQGMIGKNESHAHGGGYNHAIAGLALAESFGMAGKKDTAIAAQKAIDFSLKQFQREYGGWRYSPSEKDCDTSVTGWFIMQLKSGIVAGLRVDAQGFAGADAWLDKVSEKPGNGSAYGGRASYQVGQAYTSSMTAVALLGRQFLGYKHHDERLIGAANHLMDNTPKWDSGSSWMYYYWYYGTLAMFQMGGDWWKAWNASMRDMLVNHQIDDPTNTRLDGSWDPIRDGQAGGRAYSTAMACLCLEVYYRYLPMYKKSR